MILFNKHGKVKRFGYEVYKKTIFLIDERIYRENEKALSVHMHLEKREGDLLIATYVKMNGMVAYLPRYCNEKERGELINLIKMYYE